MRDLYRITNKRTGEHFGDLNADEVLRFLSCEWSFRIEVDSYAVVPIEVKE